MRQPNEPHRVVAGAVDRSCAIVAAPRPVTTARRRAPFKVHRSSIHGRGVLAIRRIRTGQRVIEYVGERISADEAAERYDDDAMDNHHTFLFEVAVDTLIDANRQGNAARFINHSCDPNCASYLQDGRIFIKATRNIQPGVELTYDYCFKRDGRRSPAWTQLYACHCGTANCRGTILSANRRRSSAHKRRGRLSG